MTEQNASQPPTRWHVLGTWLLLCLSLDYFPNLPAATLDSAWMQGLAQAWAHGAVPGTDIVFTYGPLAALLTGHWGGGFWLSLGVALVLGGWVAATLLQLFGRRALPAAALVFVLLPGNEALCFLFLALSVLYLVAVWGGRAPARPGSVALGGTLLMAALWGALVLAKLSFLPIVAVLVVLAAGYLALQGQRALAVGVPGVTALSLLAWWGLAGMPLAGLPTYLSDLNIILGYTSAMEWDLGLSVAGLNLQLVEAVWLYLLLAAVLGQVLHSEAQRTGKAMLALGLGAVGAIAIKAAVVRHGGGHAILPWLLFLALGGCLLQRYGRRPAVWVVIVSSTVSMLTLPVLYSGDGSSIVTLVQQAKQYAAGQQLDWASQKKRLGFWLGYTRYAPAAVWQALPSPLVGWTERVDNATQLMALLRAPEGEWQRRSLQAEQEIATRCALPDIAGRVDIYPVAIHCLLATHRDWAPRPVFQSYSVYTPALQTLNRQHLLGPQAPEALVLGIDPIDERFPALEEGSSWLCMARHFHLEGQIQDRFLVLRRDRVIDQCPALSPQPERAVQLDQSIELGCTGKPVWASFRFTPSVAGRLAQLFYKTRRLVMDVEFCQGGERSYKFIPAMATQPLLLSPVVGNAADFAQVFYRQQPLPAQEIRRLRIRYADSASPVPGWQPGFALQWWQ